MVSGLLEVKSYRVGIFLGFVTYNQNKMRNCESWRNSLEKNSMVICVRVTS